MNTTKAIGDQAEALALGYLIKQGLQLVEKNMHSPYGEIDLIMRDKKAWVFVEVRYRHHDNFGGGIESITKAKQRKLVNTANYYMQRHEKTAFESCRFDVLEISDDLTTPKIDWLEDAFRVE